MIVPKAMANIVAVRRWYNTLFTAKTSQIIVGGTGTRITWSVKVFWGGHGINGNSVTRCGIVSLRCGVAHLNNKSADKKKRAVVDSVLAIHDQGPCAGGIWRF